MDYSIILPVRNGGGYIKQCVASILAQPGNNYNLIILDSGSTDGTVEWIKAQKDPRIVFYPSDVPLTIEQNWGRIKSVPRNKWMTIIGHDDLLHPCYLTIMDALIKKHPEASLYAPHFDFIDEDGMVIRQSKPMPEVQSACEFTEKLLLNDIDAVGLVMRSDDYDAVGGFPLYPNLLFADFVIWINLAGITYKATAPECCLSYRIHRKSTTTTSNDDKYHAAYDLYIRYLIALKEKGPCYNEVINKHIGNVLRSRCLEFSKKLLQTERKYRTTYNSVKALVDKHNMYASMLIDHNTLDLATIPQIRLARLIDATAIGRKAFLLISKMLR